MTLESQSGGLPDRETTVDDDEDFGQVLVSLTIFAPSAIDELSAFERTEESRDDGWWYDLGTISIEEEDAGRRLHALDGAVSTMLDLLSEVPRAVLFDERSFVRLFLTFGRGAQTLRPALVQKIAAVNATVWIDT